MMKNVALVVAAAATAYAAPLCPLDSPGSGNNIFFNPNFFDDLAGWSTFIKGEETTLEGSITSIAGGGALFEVETAGEEAWHMQIFQAFDIPVAGETYTLVFDVEAVDDVGGEAILYIQQTASPYTFFGREACVVDDEGTITTCSVTAVIDDITAPVKFGIEAGATEGLFLITGAATCLAPAATPSPVPAGPPVPTCPAGTVNLFANPGFDGGLEPWGTFVKTTDTSLVGSITDAGSGALFDIESSGQADWHMQISQIIPVPVVGQSYTLTFVMTAEDGEGGAGDSIIQQNGGIYPFFGRTRCSVGEPGGFGSTTVCTVSAVINDLTFPVKFGFQHEDARTDGGRFTLTGAALCGPPPSGTTPAPVSTVTPAPSVVVTPAPEAVTPAPEAVTPAPEAVTPAPEAVTPAPEAVTPAPEAVTPAPEAVTPAPEAVTPAPEAATPAPEAVVTTPPVPGPLNCPDGAELFTNEGFDTGLEAWVAYVKTEGTTLVGSITSVDSGALYDVQTAAPEDWHMQLYQPLGIPVAGRVYSLSFQIAAVDAGEEREVEVYMQQDGGDYTAIARQLCAVDTTGPTICDLSALIDDNSLAVSFGIEDATSEGSFVVTGARLRSCTLEAAQFGN